MIGEKLDKMLTAKGIKAGTLARETWIPKSTIYSIIKRNNKNVNYSVMEKIASYFGVPVEYFYDAEPGPDPDPKPDDVPDGLDNFTYAAHKYAGDLRPEDKDTIIKMMQTLAAANREGDPNGKTDSTL